MRLIHAFTSMRGRAYARVRTGGFAENIRLFYASCEHHVLESILSMAQGHIVHLLLVFFPFSSRPDVILSFSCRASSSLSSCFLYLPRVMDAYKSTA